MEQIPKRVLAEDLVLWCQEECESTANNRIQQALNEEEKWAQI